MKNEKSIQIHLKTYVLWLFYVVNCICIHSVFYVSMYLCTYVSHVVNCIFLRSVFFVSFSLFFLFCLYSVRFCHYYFRSCHFRVVILESNGRYLRWPSGDESGHNWHVPGETFEAKQTTPALHC